MFWLIAIAVIASLVQMALAYYLRPKVQKRGPGELQSPFAEQGHPIAYVAGCVRKRGVNVVWKGGSSAIGKENGQMYDYYCNMMLAICQGPVDRIRRIWFGQDAVPRVWVAYSRGTGFQIHNIVNFSSTIYQVVHPPFPVGAMADVGDQDVHVGSISLAADGAVSGEWYPASYLMDPGAPTHPPIGFFAVYSKHGDGYVYTFIKPNLNDTVNINGQHSRWNGVTWVAESATTTPAKQHWKVIAENKDQNLKIGGSLLWYEGSDDQPVDWFLQKAMRNGHTAAPTYGGLCYAALAPSWLPGGITVPAAMLPSFDPGLNDFYWGEANTIPEISFEVERVPDPLGLKNDGGVDKSSPSKTAAPCVDYPSKTAEDGFCRDANPANILYEWLTSTTVGIGVPTSDVDTASFRDAGRVLFHEGVGISFDIDQQASFDDTAKEIMMVTDGVLYEDPSTGLWTYRLIREPISTATATAWHLEGAFYTRTDWQVFDEDDFEGAPEFTRGSWGDVANQIKVQFTDRSEGYAQRVVDVQDIANYQAQGEIVTIQNTYNSVFNRDLAIRLAFRDLRTLGYPRARLKDRMNRRGWSLRPGDCFIVNRDTLGISNMRFRVISIRYGTIMDGGIEFEAVEDVFGMPDTVYSEPGTGWVDPATVPPVPPAAIRAWELAYDVTRDGPQVGFAALVARGDPNTTGAVLWVSKDYRSPKMVGSIDYTPTGLLTAALSLEERTASIQLQGLTDFDLNADLGSSTDGENLILVDDELISFEGVGQNSDGSIFLSGCLRGVLDTIPRAHGLLSRAWLIHRPPPVLAEKTTNDHLELFSIQATSAGGETDIIGAPLYGGTTASRELRPIVPGNYRVGGAADLAGSLVNRVVAPGLPAGSLPITWSTRNRLTQAPGAVAQDSASIAPESGQKTRQAFIQGVDRIFALVAVDGSKIPSGATGATTTIGTASPWATIKGAVFYADTAVTEYADTEILTKPGSGSTYYIGFNLATYAIEQVSARPAQWVDLYQVVYVGSGADRTATVYDLRTPTTLRAADVTTESDTVTPTDFALSASGIIPYHHRITAVNADGLESMEARETGELFAAGYGLNYGMFYGGN